MTSRSTRAIPVVAAALLILFAYIKGHGDRGKGPVAFVREERGVPVRLSGDVENEGVFFGREEPGQRIVNYVTVAGRQEKLILPLIDISKVVGGMRVVVQEKSPGKRKVVATRLNIREAVLLGVPPDLNLLTAAEWEWLPEIGPKLAVAIVENRQLNGGFTSPDDLLKVPGIGEKKVQRLKKFLSGEDNT